MSAWTGDELDRIGAADELDIAPGRADGTPGRSTTIWVVRVADELYVRSWRGRTGGWFRRALATRTGRIRAGGVDRDVRFAQPDAGARADIDAAYRAKYACYGETYVGPMVGDDAAAATFRLLPH
jgi:hypothetical protein